jgi:hypothetical protein
MSIAGNFGHQCPYSDVGQFEKWQHTSILLGEHLNEERQFFVYASLHSLIVYILRTLTFAYNHNEHSVMIPASFLSCQSLQASCHVNPC